MSEAPRLALIGLSEQTAKSKILEIKQWFGDSTVDKTIILTDHENDKYSSAIQEREIELGMVKLEDLENDVNNGKLSFIQNQLIAALSDINRNKRINRGTGDTRFMRTMNYSPNFKSKHKNQRKFIRKKRGKKTHR